MDKKTNIRELLHHYMEGESTQAEMKQLKEYFDGEQDLPTDLIPYAQMFAIIEEETPTPSTEALDKFSEEQVLKTQRRLPALPPLPLFCWHHLSRKRKTWQSHMLKARC